MVQLLFPGTSKLLSFTAGHIYTYVEVNALLIVTNASFRHGVGQYKRALWFKADVFSMAIQGAQRPSSTLPGVVEVQGACGVR